MARPARFTEDDVLDGAARALLDVGPTVTIADVAREIQGPSGSIYHRFASREELLGRLWIRSVRRFHVGLLEAAARPDPREAVIASARHIPAFCRRHPADARAMLLFSTRRLLETGPASLHGEVAHLNDDVDQALERLAERLYPEPTPQRRELLMVATRLAPYGITRPFIAREMPDWLEDAVEAAATSIADLGGALHR
ncbi:TetR/AcrR family transcriptional regulator [Brachybacterium sp. GCM10030267]|uniref:TetR/AcrR family transcriptional regulator n=1 Tax=Brachybacterium sp. GCM10030267 TaxID=3273381 RepID=UPI00360B5298